MTLLRALIVDDEPLARMRLRRLLEEAGEAAVAECENGRAAVAWLARETADVVFLDIQMPELDGFGMLEAIASGVRPEVAPEIVFVTAHDHAVRAFDADAADYLLKPYDEERFLRALSRVRAKLGARNTSTARRSARFVVRDRGAVRLVEADELLWIKAAGNYVELHLDGAALLHREPLQAVEARLDRAQFRRIHRSIVIRLSAVAEIQSAGHGDAIVVTRTGAELPLGRRYRPEFLAALSERSS